MALRQRLGAAPRGKGKKLPAPKGKRIKLGGARPANAGMAGGFSGYRGQPKV